MMRMGLFTPSFPIYSSPDTDEVTLSQSFNVTANTGNTALNIKSLICSLRASGGLSITTGFPNLVTLSFPYLTQSGSPNSVGSLFNIQSLANLTTLWLPQYAKYNSVGAFNISLLVALTSLHLPLFQGSYAASLGLIRFAGNTALTSLSLPSLARLVLGLTVSGNTLLTSIAAPLDTLTFQSGAAVAFDFSANALPTAEVNRLMRLLANNTAITSAGSSVNFTGGTNGAPSGDGLTAKTTLTGRGVVVTNN